MEELVDTLSDEDLYCRLKEFKPDIGPVVDSTRSLYKRLLVKALEGDANVASILNSSRDSHENVEKPGPMTRSKVSIPAEEDEATEEDSQSEDDAEDDFEILDNQELEGEDHFFQRSGADTATAEANNFLIKTVLIGFVFAVLAIIAVAVWIPPTKKD